MCLVPSLPRKKQSMCLVPSLPCQKIIHVFGSKFATPKKTCVWFQVCHAKKISMWFAMQKNIHVFVPSLPRKKKLNH